MARDDRDEILGEEERDPGDEVEGGSAAALASSFPGAAVAGGLAPVSGEAGAIDAIEGEAGGGIDADLADTPGTYAGGGATSSGQDYPDRDRPAREGDT